MKGTRVNERIAELDRRLEELFHLYVNQRTYEIFGGMCNSSTYETMNQINELITERADEIFLDHAKEK